MSNTRHELKITSWVDSEHQPTSEDLKRKLLQRVTLFSFQRKRIPTLNGEKLEIQLTHKEIQLCNEIDGLIERHKAIVTQIEDYNKRALLFVTILDNTLFNYVNEDVSQTNNENK